jgi:hypothetical protein
MGVLNRGGVRLKVIPQGKMALRILYAVLLTSEKSTVA